MSESVSGLPHDLGCVAPRFETGTLADVLPSAAAAMGLGGELGVTDSLGLPAARSVVVMLVDGLGAELVRRRSGHLPVLSRAWREGPGAGRAITAGFPSTTSVSLASLGTGTVPGRTGMIGYRVLDPARGVIVNQLNPWDDAVDPHAWQPTPTVFERIAALGDEVTVATVSNPEFRGTGLTEAVLRGGTFLGYRTLAQRVDAALRLLRRGPALVYLYWEQLDRVGHVHGWQSEDWIAEAEALDWQLRRLIGGLPRGADLVVVADHGMVDLDPGRDPDSHIDVRRVTGAMDRVRLIGGEPRMRHLYVDPADVEDVHRLWSERFGDVAWVVRREEAIAAGWFGVTDPAPWVTERMGQVIVAAREAVGFFDPETMKPRALDLVGHHGSLSDAELHIPLVVHAG